MSQQDKVTLFNIALGSIGAKGTLMTSPDEQTRRGNTLRTWLPPITKFVFRSAWWGSGLSHYRMPILATRTSTASWVEGDPNPGWKYAYGLPSDFLYPRFISTFEKFEMGLAKTTEGEVKAIHSSAEVPILTYTRLQDNYELWEPDLYMAVGHALGATIAQELTGKSSRGRSAQARANELITTARLNSANEDEDMLDSLPEWIQARGYANVAQLSRYTYPFGPLVGAASGGESVK